MKYGLPKTILLDLDDTIIATSVVTDVVWQSVTAEFAPRLLGHSPQRMLEAFQEHRRWYWSDPVRHRDGRMSPPRARRELIEGTLNRLGILDPSLAGEMSDIFSAWREDAVQPFPEAVETLRRLRECGVRLALITNGEGEGQRRKIETFGLARFFECVLIEGEFGVGKPDERVYLHALEHLNSRPSEAWMVGDNLEWEVAAPQKLGLYSIWVDSLGAGLPESVAVRPDRIIQALPDLLKRP